MGPSVSPHDDGSVSEKVIRAVAEAEGINPRVVTPPLYEVVDPEALDRIFQPSTGSGPTNGNLTFSYSGHQITVGENGEVMVYSDIVH
jgi:hypothetical protein